MEWQPIDTAQKDGTPVFFFVPDEQPQQAACRWAVEWGDHACGRPGSAVRCNR